MKKILYFCSFIILMLLAGCQRTKEKKEDIISPVPLEELHYPKSLLQIKHIAKQQKTADQSQMLVLGDYAYPQIENRDELPTIDAVNEKIRSDACEGFEKSYEKGIAYANLYYNGLAGNKEDGWVLPFVTEQAFHVKYNDFFILSVKVNGYSDFGGAHPDTYQFSYTYDLRTGKELPVTYFYGENEKAAKAYASEAFIEKVMKEPEGFYEDAVDILLKGDYSYGYYLTENGITLYINPYEIAPYAAGVIETTIEYDANDSRFHNLSALGIE